MPSFSTAVARRSRFIANRIQRATPVERKRCLLLLGLLCFLSIFIVFANFATATLDGEQNDTHRQLSKVLLNQGGLDGGNNQTMELVGENKHLDQAEEITMMGDVVFYPIPPKRPSIMPGVDENHFHGRIGYPPNSDRPLWTPKVISFRMTPEQKRQAHEGYCFNTRVSSSLELDRKVPDYNSQKCLNVEYNNEELDPADVVIVFHNEDLSVLLRSIHSILNRTPPQLLKSIILVNDDSNRTSHPWLFDELPQHVAILPKTKLIHLTNRRGLMMARMEGTKIATADIVVYLDSHIECTPRWLEPMLAEITRDPKRVVTPLIHSIDPDNFDFEIGAVSVVGFTWSLGQSHPDRPTDHFTPMESPVMAGGLFAANRHWFQEELGGYDPEMKLYGGEEMEIGFKVWQCGGSLVALPCSRVGHIFRTDKFWKGQVYKVPFEEIIRNKLRTAEVWLDEYKEIAKLAMSVLPPDMTLGPLDEVLAVRERLQCKSFKWYIDRVFPELWIPDLNNTYKGALKNNKLRACLDTLGSKSTNEALGAYPCHGHHGSQAFLMSLGDGSLRSAASSFVDCAHKGKDLGGGNWLLHQAAGECNKNKWTLEPVGSEEGGLMKLNGKECLRVQNGNFQNKSPYTLVLTGCDESDPQQLWTWID